MPGFIEAALSATCAAPTTTRACKVVGFIPRDAMGLHDLFHFVTRRDVPYTDNACERARRLCHGSHQNCRC
jgi:hypothetical protein